MGMGRMMVAAIALATTGCMTQGATTAGGRDNGPGASAEIADARGMPKASAGLVPERAGIRVEINASGMAPGTYGAHIHTAGRCDGPGFESAGGHWNPTGRQHGAQNPQGKHLGDLPNLMVNAQGTGRLVFRVENASLQGGANPLLDADGAAIVIHAQPDDYRTDPSGSSGARIACGIVHQGNNH
jgi:Cu-Zn family superoxide dismutase